MIRLGKIIAILMLGAMFVLMFASSWNDSAIFDEIAHIGAGFTYLKYQDSRLNPEHPPLLKSLAAAPLLFLNLKENITKEPLWTLENVNDRQWAAGNALLYNYGNDPDHILHWARFPMMMLAILLGWILFKWVSGMYGQKVGLLTLFFFATSPTFIAHSRFVTTDTGAALGFLLGIIFFLKFLKQRDKKSLIFCGIILGIVELFKFSLVLLLPTYFIAGLLWVFLERSSYLKFIGRLLLIGAIALVIIWAAYSFYVWNYPQAQQLADAKYILAGYRFTFLPPMVFWLIEHNFTKPLGQYFFGFLMVARRTAGGNTAYFMGELSSKGWPQYFPVLALTKEQLGFYLFLVISIIFGAVNIKRAKRSWIAAKEWLYDNFALTISCIFIAIYWATSLANPLNIGVRHVLPTFPFLYLLVARQTVKWMHRTTIDEPGALREWIKFLYENYLKPAPKYLFVSVVILWMAAEMILAFPYYLSYYNALGGGLAGGYHVATDSNYDWGQDLKRLRDWVNQNNVQKIYLDYFGGGSPQYYLGDKFIPWWSAKGAPPAGSYFAVSLNSLIGDQAKPVGDITIKPEDTYPWLKNKTPISRGGSSILIFKIN